MFGQGKETYSLLYTEEKGTTKQRLNPSLPKQIKTILHLEREVLIVQKDKEIKELQKSIQEDKEIADDESEDQAIKKRARERISKNQEQIDVLENERKELEEGTSPRERERRKHIQEIRFHGLSCCLDSQNNDWESPYSCLSAFRRTRDEPPKGLAAER